MNGSTPSVQDASASFQLQRIKWQGIVESLGQEFSCPLPEVERMLSATARQFEQDARIKDFILILAVKQVKDVLRKSRYVPMSLLHEQTQPLPHISTAPHSSTTILSRT
jgi:hypothetical protein